MEQMRRLASYFLPEKCMTRFLVDLDFSNLECWSILISKALGTGIIIGSTLVKVPQILKIANAKSSVGISFFGVLLELFAVTSNAAYSYANRYPFSAWGEALFLLVETAIIAYLVLFYSGKRREALAFLAVYGVCLYAVMSGLTPISVLWALNAFNLPVVVVAKLIQAFSNVKNGHTGQLSAITITLLFLGSIARIFTSMQETGDSLIILTYVVATAANFILVAQIFYYREATKRFLAKKEK